MNIYRIWPLLPACYIPDYLQWMENRHGLRFAGLCWLPLFAKYQPISFEESSDYTVDYFPSSSLQSIQNYFDLCESSGWEPVLQVNDYKIYRDKGGADPLYANDSERRHIWIKAWKKKKSPLFFNLYLIFFTLWSLLSLSRDSIDGYVFLTPCFSQIFMFLLIILFWLATVSLILSFIFPLIFRRKPLGTVKIACATLLRLLVWGLCAAILIFFLLATLQEYMQTNFYWWGILITLPLIHYYFSWHRDEFSNRKIKGIYRLPQKISLAIALFLSSAAALTVIWHLHVVSERELSDQTIWIRSHNVICSELLYRNTSDSLPLLCYLRTSGLSEEEIYRRKEKMLSQYCQKHFPYQYGDLSGLKAKLDGTSSDAGLYSFADAFSDVDNSFNSALLPHIRALDILQEHGIEKAFLNSFGTGYILSRGNSIYRLNSPTEFFTVTDKNEDEIQQMAEKIADNLLIQMEELDEKTISNSCEL